MTDLKNKIRKILDKHVVLRAGLFGSYSRGDYSEDSNIDILVEIGTKISLLDFVRDKTLFTGFGDLKARNYWLIN